MVSDLRSVVFWINCLNAAHLLPLLQPVFTTSPLFTAASPTVGKAAICAMFLLNLSFSRLIKASFFFIAPGLLFKLVCLIFALPTTIAPSVSLVVSGNASAKDSRVVISFLDGRLRFLDGAFDFSMREMRAECFIMRLSFFVVLNNPSLLRSLEMVLGREELDLRVGEVAEGRLLITGAYMC